MQKRMALNDAPVNKALNRRVNSLSSKGGESDKRVNIKEFYSFFLTNSIKPPKYIHLVYISIQNENLLKLAFRKYIWNV